MQIKNTTTGLLIISDIPGAQGGSGLNVPAGETVAIFDEDAERSQQLESFIASGAILVVGAAEPATDTSVGQTPAADVTEAVEALGFETIIGAKGPGKILLGISVTEAVWQEVFDVLSSGGVPVISNGQLVVFETGGSNQQ
jgi:hypothetical protein